MFSFTAKRISLMRSRSASVARRMVAGMAGAYAPEVAEEQAQPCLSNNRLAVFIPLMDERGGTREEQHRPAGRPDIGAGRLAQDRPGEPAESRARHTEDAQPEGNRDDHHDAQ